VLPWPELTSKLEAWSHAIDDTLIAADAISRQQPHNVDQLLVRFEAVWWWIDLDDSVLDGSARRWLQRFRSRHHTRFSLALI
jgi:hypothetical protein